MNEYLHNTNNNYIFEIFSRYCSITLTSANLEPILLR